LSIPASRRRSGLALGLALAILLGCADGDGRDVGGGRPANFDEQVCRAVAHWAAGIAAAVNGFQAGSRDAEDASDRRLLYLEAWEGVDQANGDLRTDLADLDIEARPYGQAVVDALTAALDASDEEAAAGRAEGEELPDEAYEGLTVPEGSLVTGTEKIRAKVFHALTDVAAAEGVDALRGECGRPAA
jgi:hypothetical protein